MGRAFQRESVFPPMMAIQWHFSKEIIMPRVPYFRFLSNTEASINAVVKSDLVVVLMLASNCMLLDVDWFALHSCISQFAVAVL